MKMMICRELENSGASYHFVDEDLVPGLRQRIRGLRILEEMKHIETAGNKKVVTTATGTICGHIVNPSGKPIRIFAYFRTRNGTPLVLLGNSNEIGSNRHISSSRFPKPVQQGDFSSAESARKTCGYVLV